MRRAKLLWKGSGSWEFQALLVSGWSYREKFWKFDLKKIGGAMNILGARVKRVFPPSWPVFLDGRPGRLLDWSICYVSLLPVPSHAVFLFILFFRFKGRAHMTWRTLEVSGASSRIPGSLIFSILSFTRTPPKSGTQEIFSQTEFLGQTSRSVHSWRGGQRRQQRGSKAGQTDRQTNSDPRSARQRRVYGLSSSRPRSSSRSRSKKL